MQHMMLGNMSPYVTSYIRAYTTSSNLRYDVSTWIFALAAGGQGAAMFLGGIINAKIGPRWTTLLGSWIMRLANHTVKTNQIDQ